MSRNPPQTLSVKRKRNEAPVDSLVVERTEKRQKSDVFSLPGNAATPSGEQQAKSDAQDGTVVYRLRQVPNGKIPLPIASPATQSPRRFLIDKTTGQRVLVEDRPVVEDKHATNSVQAHPSCAQEVKTVKSVPNIVVEETSHLRKRPGPAAALRPKATAKSPYVGKAEPSEDVVRQFEKFSDQVEREELDAPKQVSRPSRFNVKPNPPKLRYKDRHPEKAAAQEAKDSEAMQVDTEEYVYDTYVREIILPDADGKIPEPQGTVGFIVINEEDVVWWNGDDESDREFDLDDEDENAEDYYANDYPEDELSSNDEYDRDPYKYRADRDEEYDLDDADNDDDDDKDESFRQSVPLPLPIIRPSPGYWGLADE
ncbi:hypothetical protein K505DRAFT_407562 [Melanomma pulvis-pyrius CBS 109.77]|uniref:Transcription factor Iwr1 domain-containing protein n=1 Tax=Melanomma pulvis-pyrius CBS 109.77 TaxID=1314802 RepID=A0A6A6XEA8_9PLEO|nr:hypothetical protein K505DRAFT_407562 [Melanomma pulvis-pyrius CBS 109.77]